MRRGLLLVVVGLVLALAACQSETITVSDVAEYEPRSINYSDPNSIVAKVNGEDLTVADVASSAIRYGVEPTLDTFDALLEGLIVARLAMQNAPPVDEADLDARMDDIAGNLTGEELDAVLAAQGLSASLVRERIREELAMNELFGGEVIEPTGDEIRDYYAENAASFVSPERVVIRHFFVANTTLSEQEQLERLQGYVDANASERCAYIEEYSDDRSTAGEEVCGLLAISRGSTIPELEYGAYGTQPGRTRVVSSRVGTHIITGIGIVPATRSNLTSAEPAIRRILTAQERSRVAARTTSNMLKNAEIVIYLGR